MTAPLAQVFKCDTEKFECDGSSKRERLSAPDAPQVKRRGRNSVNVTIVKANHSLSYRVELDVSKRAELVGAENTTLVSSMEAGTTFVHFVNLNFDTTYYARVRSVDDAGSLSVVSEWSDPAPVPCPVGGQCNGGESVIGVPIGEVFARDGELLHPVKGSSRDRAAQKSRAEGATKRGTHSQHHTTHTCRILSRSMGIGQHHLQTLQHQRFALRGRHF